jgi:hypothetical protein
VTEVDRIAEIQDPVLRNLQITQCYAELSSALTVRTGFSANWCTFATWASRQAGQSIRKEDLYQTLERLLEERLLSRQAAEVVVQQIQRMGPNKGEEEILRAVRKALNIQTAVERASDAVGRGNKKVFVEIGREFARFYQECLNDEVPDVGKLERFCAGLRPGEPPGGQRYLNQAFHHYYRAFFIQDPRQRAQLMLCANLEIGLHEQTRLQPEIAEALDAGFVNPLQFTRLVLAASFPFSGWLVTSQWIGRRLFGQKNSFDRAAQVLLGSAEALVRHALTETMMTIYLPPNLTVRLGADLTEGFPDSLRLIDEPDLRILLAQVDKTQDSLVESGALDWANLPDRMNFIADLFRCYQEWRDLFDPPFTPEQTAAIKAGRMPEGELF